MDHVDMLLILVVGFAGSFLVAAEKWRHYREACMVMQAKAYKAGQLTRGVIDELDAAIEEFETYRPWRGAPATTDRLRRLYIARGHAHGCSAVLSRCNIRGRSVGDE